MGLLIVLYHISFLEGWGLVGAYFCPIPKVRPEAHTPTEERKGL